LRDDASADLSDFIEANEPRLIAFNEYVSDDGTEVGVVQVRPDTDERLEVAS
jgi:hypothetical protein